MSFFPFALGYSALEEALPAGLSTGLSLDEARGERGKQETGIILPTEVHLWVCVTASSRLLLLLSFGLHFDSKQQAIEQAKEGFGLNQYSTPICNESYADCRSRYVRYDDLASRKIHARES